MNALAAAAVLLFAMTGVGDTPAQSVAARGAAAPGAMSPARIVRVAQARTAPRARAAPAGIDVTGHWRLLVDGDDRFSADLRYDPQTSRQFGGERIYCGMTNRTAAPLQVCAHVNAANGAFEAIIAGVRGCTAPYRREGAMEGECVFMGQVRESFSASFVPVSAR